MRATVASIFFAATAFAQQNPFNVPDGGYNNAEAGQSLDLSWQPTTGGTVTLVLRSGDSTNLQAGTEITSNAPNNGHYTWPVPSDITKGFTYTVQIISDQGDINYTPYFPIDSSNVAPSSTSIVATGAPTGSAAALPAVPPSLAAQQSSIQSSASAASPSSEARTADMSTSMSMSSMSSMPTDMSSMSSGMGSMSSSMDSAMSSEMSMTMTSGGSMASSTGSPTIVGSESAGGTAASATGAQSTSTGGAAAVQVGAGLLAGLAGAVAWAL
ncbi:MAG: hypothetical protein Q9159_001806 [Coniocarpon cinnabarinum]